MKHIATAILVAIVLAAAAPNAQDPERLFKAAMNTELVEGNLRSAIEQYRKVARSAPRPLAAQALLRMAESYQKLGDLEARAVYERIVREFGDQRDTAAAARTRLTAMRPLATEPVVQTARREWAGPDVGWGGTPTLDGRYLTFANGATGDLAIRDLATDTTRLLTNTGGWLASADYNNRSVLSSDGRLVAYHWFIDATRSDELRVMRTDDPSSSRVLLRLQRPDYIEPLGLTPDGGHVVVQRRFELKTWQLGLVSTSDGSYRSLKSLDWRAPQGASLSPDGRRLAYDLQAGDPGSPRDIFLLALDGSSETTAVAGPGDDTNPVWTADGSRLVFLSNRNGNPGLWTVSVENGRTTGSPVLVKADTGPIWLFGVTKAGTLYYQVSGAQRQNIYTAPMESLKATGNPSLVTEQFVDFSTGPSWSPDGQALAFFSLRNRPTLVVRSLATGAERTVPLPQGLQIPFQAGPRWFPDNRSVLVLVNEPPGQAFYRVSTETGAADRLHRITPGVSSFVLSPDGRSIFWSVQGTTDEQSLSRVLMRYDIEEARETVLKRGEWFIAVALSPDGTQLAYLKSVRPDPDRKGKEAPSVVEVIPAMGGPARQVYRDPIWYGGSRYNTLAWTPDSQSLMFVRDDGLLWRVPATGGEPQQMGIAVKGRLKNPSIHPNGKQIVFSIGLNDDNEVWALENFLPERRARLDAPSTQPATRGDRAVWTGPKVDLFGRVSPDERFISYTDWTSAGYSNLSLHDLRTNTDRFLTGNKSWFNEEPKDPNWGEAQWSAVSPDGQQIAYAWFNQKVSEVRVVSVADGPTRRPRTLLKFTDAAPGVRDWSPDGKLLAIGTERSDKSTQIVIATVADSSMRILKTMSWRGAQQLFFSRDSRFVAFDLPASDDDNVQQRDVFIIAVDGSREVRAVADASDDRVAGWSPDGKYLLFSSTRTGARSLWALRVADGRPQGRPELVKTDIGSSFSLGVGNSGALYLHKTVSSRDVKIAPIDLNAGTVGQTRHFSQGLLPRPFTPHWSPDGKFLAYQVRGDEEGLAIRSVETGEVRRLRNIQYVPDPRWSSDGRSLIAGMEDSKGRMGIYRIDAQSGDSTFIVSTESLAFPRWSADGTKIYYINRRPFQTDERQIRERDLRTGVERDLFSHRLLSYFEVSPDGRSLAVPTQPDPASQTTSLWIVPIAEGRPRELARIPISESVTNTRPAIAWTPDSSALLTARRSGAANELWLVDVDSGRGRKLDIDVSEWTLGQGDGPIGGFSLSPDGRSIAFLMGKSGAEVWALENFLTTLK